MPETETSAPKKGWIKEHKGIAIGLGGVVVFGVAYYIYRHRTTSSATSTASSTGVTSAASRIMYYTPYATSTGATTGAGGGTLAQESGSVFAGQLANAFKSQFGNGTRSHMNSPSATQTTSHVVPSALTNQPAANSSPAPQPSVKQSQPANTVKTILGSGTAVSPPKSISIKGVSFAPTREIKVGNSVWYGIPNTTVAGKLNKQKANIKKLLGGSGEYVQG